MKDTVQDMGRTSVTDVSDTPVTESDEEMTRMEAGVEPESSEIKVGTVLHSGGSSCPHAEAAPDPSLIAIYWKFSLSVSATR